MSWEEFYQGIHELKRWWQTTEIPSLALDPEVPYVLKPIREIVEELKKSSELQSLLEKDLEIHPTVGLCGFQSAGKTELIRNFLPLDSPFRHFFLSTHWDTTSPIVYVRFSQKEGNQVVYRLLSQDGNRGFPHLWGKIYQASSESEDLYKLFWQILSSLPSSFSLPVQGKSAEFFEVLALATVVKDLNFVSEKLAEQEGGLLEEVFASLCQVLPSLEGFLPLIERIRERAAGALFSKEAELTASAKKLLYVAYLFSVLLDSVFLEVPFASQISRPFLLVDAPGFSDCGVSRNLWGFLTDWMAKRNRLLIGSRATYEFDILLLCVNSSQLGAKATGDLASLRETLLQYEREEDKVDDWLSKRVVIVFTVLDQAMYHLIWQPMSSVRGKSPAQKVEEVLQIPYAQESHRLDLPRVPFLAFQTPKHLSQTRATLHPEVLAEKEKEVEAFLLTLEREMIASSQVNSTYLQKLTSSLISLFRGNHSSFEEHMLAFFQALEQLVDKKGVEAARSRLFGGKWEKLEKIFVRLQTLPFEEILSQVRKVSDPRYVVKNLEKALEASRLWVRQGEENLLSVETLREHWKEVFHSRIPLEVLETYEKVIRIVQEESKRLATFLPKLRG